jgi:hypothetical protein
MHRPLTIRLHQTIREALTILQFDGLEGLPITDEQGQIVGYADELELLSLGIHANYLRRSH